jgi:hypothetical protein
MLCWFSGMLQMGKNPVSPEGALLLIKALGNDVNKLAVLDLSVSISTVLSVI